jgi:hypothetical protein
MASAMGKQAAARSSVKLIELEQQMVAGAGVMTVPDAAFRQLCVGLGMLLSNIASLSSKTPHGGRERGHMGQNSLETRGTLPNRH